MQMVAIIGAGDLGATTARALATTEVAREIRLIDEGGEVAVGKALDLVQANPIEGIDVRVTASPDLDAIRGAVVVVVADRLGAEGEWQGEPALALLDRVRSAAPAAPVVCAGAKQLDLMRLALAELRFPRTRLVGSAPEALRAAAQSMVALTVNGAPRDVALSLAGVPPAWVFGWTAATIAGQPLASRLTEAERSRAERRALACWPPRAFALGSAAARTVTTMLTSARRELICFAGLEVPGQRIPVAAVPVRLGPAGILAIQEPAFSPRERVEFETSLSR